ncbi:hypothetical protein DPX16_19765 [Anabarilius grahami]|uniref:Uncharacterized protein n=1 Tax=Anabarilius grahami TaxID=495550 RepID=A0A3N0XR03_ANAGA|nr:hypothetical protein DPX16_19765 [Anabarilius grahami]
MWEQWNTDASKDGKFHQRPMTSLRVPECCVTSLRVEERSEDLVKWKNLTHSVIHSGCFTELVPLSRKDRITVHFQKSYNRLIVELASMRKWLFVVVGHKLART